MNEIFLPLGYSCFVFSVFLSAFVYVLYFIVSMFLSIYTSVSGNFGYFLSVPSIYDSLAICMFWINSQATPGTKASRFLYLIRWKIYLYLYLYLCQILFPLQSSTFNFSSCTVMDTQIFYFFYLFICKKYQTLLSFHIMETQTALCRASPTTSTD